MRQCSLSMPNSNAIPAKQCPINSKTETSSTHNGTSVPNAAHSMIPGALPAENLISFLLCFSQEVCDARGQRSFDALFLAHIRFDFNRSQFRCFSANSKSPLDFFHRFTVSR